MGVERLQRSCNPVEMNSIQLAVELVVSQGLSQSSVVERGYKARQKVLRCHVELFGFVVRPGDQLEDGSRFQCKFVVMSAYWNWSVAVERGCFRDIFR